jgi:hypothetical protein
MLEANSGPHANGTSTTVKAVDGHDIQAGKWPGRVRTLIKVHGIQEGPGLQAGERMGAKRQHGTGILWERAAGTLVLGHGIMVLVPGEEETYWRGVRSMGSHKVPVPWGTREADKKRGNSLLEHADELGGCKVTGTASWRRGRCSPRVTVIHASVA